MHILKPVSRLLLAFLMALSISNLAWSTPLVHAAPQAPLNADGTINLKTGYNGNLDVSQYGITLDPVRGPVLAPLASPPDWDALGVGLNDYVTAIAVSGTDVYVGGNFTQAGGDFNANYIAKWNGTTWSALGTTPLNQSITAIAIHGTDIYVGGGFTDAGNDPNADYLAKWNGTSWSALGGVPFSTSYPTQIDALTFDGNDLYVGGYFNNAGGNPNADHIAKWNGTSWLDFGTTQLDSAIHCITVSGTDLYVGGEFGNINGDYNANHIAKWNGSSWSAIGNGLSNSVYTIAVNGTDIYAGGYFTNAGGDANADYIAKWNGTNWSALGTTSLINSVVYSIAIDGTNIYIGGFFTDAGGDANADNIAKWDGTSWSAVMGGLNGAVGKIVISGTSLYIGGMFMDVLSPNTSGNHIGKWNGSAWSSLDAGLNNDVYDIAISGSDVYVGGTFTDAGGNSNADYIAKWDGTNWSALGTAATGGPGSGVHDILVNGSDIYVSGGFSNMGGNSSADNIAKWNGTSWSALGAGIPIGEVYSLAMIGSTLYAGGVFSNAGGDANADYLAKWNGAAWSAVSGTSFSNTIDHIATDGSNLYISGGGSGGIRKWNGTSLSTLSSGSDPIFPTNGATDMKVIGTDLYVSGSFYIYANNDYEYTIGKWNGTDWSQVGTSLNGINAIAIDGTNVYASGWFTEAGGNPNIQGFAKWDGTSWAAVGSVTTHYYARAIVINGADILIGGAFTSGLDHVGKISIPALPTPTPTVTPTETVTATATETATLTATPTATETVTATATETVTLTATPTATETVTATATETVTLTATPTTPKTVTRTQTAIAPFTATSTKTATRTATRTITKTATQTRTATKTATPVSVTFVSVPAEDGTVLESSETSGIGGVLDAASGTFSVGDNAANKQFRGVLSFNTGAGLPDTATITGVILKVKQSVIVGSGNPVSILQGFMLDIKNGFFASATTLQLSDFHAVASGSYGPATPTPVNNVYSFNLVNGKAFINKLSSNSGVTQIRLRFNLDDNNDMLANALSLFSGNATLAADRPQLVITYTLP